MKEWFIIWEDFKKFAFQGNVLDLAVAVVIGTAFSAIVTSLVEDVIMPFTGILVGGIDFTGLSLTVGEAEILYGRFIQTIFNFFVIAFSIFVFVRLLMKLKRTKEEEAEEVLSKEEELLTEIRDLLKEKNIK